MNVKLKADTRGVFRAFELPIPARAGKAFQPAVLYQGCDEIGACLAEAVLLPVGFVADGAHPSKMLDKTTMGPWLLRI